MRRIQQAVSGNRIKRHRAQGGGHRAESIGYEARREDERDGRDEGRGQTTEG